MSRSARRPFYRFNLKTAVAGHKKAQRAQNERSEVEMIVTDPVSDSLSAKFSFLCAFWAFCGQSLF